MAESYSVEAYLRATGVNQFTSAFRSASRSVQGLGKTTQNANLTIGKLAGAIGITKLLSLGFRGIKDSVNIAFGRIDTMEQFNQTMGVMVGDQKKVQKALDETNDYVSGTSYTLDGMARSVQNFVTRGVKINKATGYISAWGDAVAFYGDGSQEQFDNVADALGKMLTKGTVGMDQLSRVMHAGIPAVDIFADATGRSASEVQEALSNGEISAEEFVDTVTKAMMEGGKKFPAIAGSAKEAGLSWGAVWSNMRARAGAGVQYIIEKIDEMLESNGLPDMRQMLDNFATSFKGVLERVGDSIPIIVGKFIEWKNAMQPIIPIITAIIGVIGSMITGVAIINSLRSVFNGLKIAIFGVNMTMLKNPIGLVLGLIIGLVAGIMYLWKTNEGFREFFTNAWQSIKEVAMIVWDSIKGFVVPIAQEVVGFVMEIFQQLVDFWNEHGQMIWQATQNVWTFISQIISVAMQVIFSIMQAIWPVVKFLVVETWNAIKGTIQGALDIILGLVQFFSALFTGNWTEVWNAVKRIFFGALKFLWNIVQITFLGRIFKAGKMLGVGLKGVITRMWGAIRNVFSTTLSFLKNIVMTGFNAIRSVISRVMNRIDSIIKTIWNGIRSVISRVMNVIKNIITTIWNAIRTAITSVLNAIKSVVTTIWNAIRSVINSVMNRIRSIITTIWNSIKSVITTVSNAIKSTISRIFNSLRGIVSRAFNGVRSAVRNGMSGALRVVTGAVGKFFNAGKNIVSSIADGIKKSIGKVTGAMKNVVKKARDMLPFSPAKEGPLKDLNKLDFGNPISDSILKARSAVQSSLNKILGVPDINMSVVGKQIKDVNQGYKSKHNRSNLKGESNQYTIILRLGNHDYRVFVDDITKTQERMTYTLERV